MATAKLPDKELRAINNYIQHMLYKCAQCIVQSRSGNKVQTASKATIADWFNLTIRDLPEVHAEAKTVFTSGDPNECLKQPACIEVSLKTADNETMLLEYWWLMHRADVPLSHCVIRSASTVYGFCERLIKSLLTLSRSTPAYRLSRRQSTQEFTVRCKLLTGEPTLLSADNFKSHMVGTVPYPKGGAIVLYLAYRPNPHMYARRISSVSASSVSITDDYFDVTPTSPPSQHRYPSTSSSAFSNPPSTASCMTVPSPTLPLENNFNSEAEGSNRWGQNILPPEGNFKSVSGSPGGDRWTKPKRPAFACESPTGCETDREISDEIPFASLLRCSPPGDGLDEGITKDSDNPLDEKRFGCEVGDLGSNTEIRNNQSREDFVLLELRAPFAGQEEDLGRFYLECQSAPALSMFEAEDFNEQDSNPVFSSGINGALSTISDQLAKFEANANDFTEFINSLQEVDN